MNTQRPFSCRQVPHTFGRGVSPGLLLVGIGALLIGGGVARGQLTLNYVVDTTSRDSTFPVVADRQDLDKSVARARRWFEAVFASSSATFDLPIIFVGTTLAGSLTSPVETPWSTVRNQLISTSESPTEDAVYEQLPVSSVPYTFDFPLNPAQPRNTTEIFLTFPQAREFGLNVAQPSIFNFRIRMQASATLWFFGRGTPGAGQARFVTTLVHETMHMMGFTSADDFERRPGGVPALSLLDVLRLPAGQSATSTALASTAREIRRGQEANFITRLNASDQATGAYPASTGPAPGDGFQMSHFKRLPPVGGQVIPIGIMAPDDVGEDNGNADPLIGQVRRPDLEVMDMVGWKLNPATSGLIIGVAPVQQTPLPNQLVRSGCPLLSWTDPLGIGSYVINLYTYDPSIPGTVARPTEFEDITSTTFCPPVPLAPGNYWWEVVSVPPNYFDGFGSGWRKFTIACLADFGGANQSMGPDGLITADDVIVFLGRFFDGDLMADLAGKNQSTIPDGFLSADDIIVFLSAFFAGC